MLYAVSRSSTPARPFVVRDSPRPPQGFAEDLREFISSRLDRVDPYQESEEYCRLQEKASRLFERLLEMLPEEGRALLMEYTEAASEAHCLEVAILAERAFLDGVRLAVRAMGGEE